MRICDWSSDVCSSDLCRHRFVVIDGGNDFETFVGATRRQDDRIGPLVFAHLAHGLAHVVGNKTFDFHADLHAYFLRSEEQTSELQSLMRISYAVLCFTKNIAHFIFIYVSMIDTISISNDY